MSDSNASQYAGDSTFGTSLSIEIAESSIDAMSISPSGRDVVLASRKGLLVVDLDNPYEPPRSLNHSTSWNVADVQWNVHQHKTHWVASTSNQKLLVWNLDLPSRRAIEHVLHGHTRAITDINWSAHHPEILASCSVDSFVHCWDLRDPRKPVNAFSDWKAGATQVKWNRQNEHIIASSHERFLRIWDDRKGASPLKSIEVADHSTKIYGIDFNRTRETGIISCSLDKSIKFWDYALDTKTPEQIILTDTPVWRARHTPMGWGLVTLPQRGDNSLYLWDRRGRNENTSHPVQKFEGHTDQVKEFLWRSRGGSDPNQDDRDFQLITWSKDQTLRLWPISEDTLTKIGHDSTKPIRFRQTRRGAVYKSYRPVTGDQKSLSARPISSLGRAMHDTRKSQNEPLLEGPGHTMTKPGTIYKGFSPVLWMRGVRMNRKISGPVMEQHTWGNEALLLGEEFPAIEAKFPRVKFEEASVKLRTCTMTLQGPWGQQEDLTFLRLKIVFPSGYPAIAVPEFQLEKTNAISEERHRIILTSLHAISNRYKDRSRPSLEALVRFLLGEDTLNDKFDDESDGSESSSDDEDINALFPYSDMNDAEKIQQNVPLPRNCGAVFCGTKLVTFFSGIEVPHPIVHLNSSQPPFKSSRHRGQRLFPSFGQLKGTNTEPSSEVESDDDFDYDEMASSRTIDPKLTSKRGSTSVSERISTRKPISIKSGGQKNEHSLDYVSIRDFSREMQLRPTLASKWRFDKSSGACLENASQSLDMNELDLADAWEMTALIVTDQDQAAVGQYQDSLEPHTTSDPLFGRNALAGDILNYFLSEGNVQMSAMLSCVVDTKVTGTDYDNQISKASISSRPMLLRHESSDPLDHLSNMPHSLSSGKVSWKAEAEDDIVGPAYCDRKDSQTSNTPHGSAGWLGRLQGKSASGTNIGLDNSLKAPQNIQYFFDRYSPDNKRAKWSDNTQDYFDEVNPQLHVEMLSVNQTTRPNISSETRREEEAARSAYAEILYKMKLNIERCEVLSHNTKGLRVQESSGVEVSKRCSNCSHTSTKRCNPCHGSSRAVICSICAIAVKGQLLFCLICEHGGHPRCIQAWRSSNEACPSGCSCQCSSKDIHLETVSLEQSKLTNNIRQLWRATGNVAINANKFG